METPNPNYPYTTSSGKRSSATIDPRLLINITLQEGATVIINTNGQVSDASLRATPEPQDIFAPAGGPSSVIKTHDVATKS